MIKLVEMTCPNCGGFIAISATSSSSNSAVKTSHSSGNTTAQSQADDIVTYSRFFRQFTKAVFQKEPEQVTDEELQSITYLDLNIYHPLPLLPSSMPWMMINHTISRFLRKRTMPTAVRQRCVRIWADLPTCADIMTTIPALMNQPFLTLLKKVLH